MAGPAGANCGTLAGHPLCTCNTCATFDRPVSSKLNQNEIDRRPHKFNSSSSNIASLLFRGVVGLHMWEREDAGDVGGDDRVGVEGGFGDMVDETGLKFA